MSYNLDDNVLLEVLARLKALEIASPLGFSSVSKGQTRFIGEESLQVEGSARTTGTQYIDGRLEGSGVFNWTGEFGGSGPFNWTGTAGFDGDVGITKTLDVTATSRFRAKATVEADLELTGAGKFKAGVIEITPTGEYGGSIYSGSNLGIYATYTKIASAQTDLTGNVNVAGNLTVTARTRTGSLETNGSKQFIMPHPLKRGHWLAHGSTESPVSGTEYTGTVTIGDDGSARVVLPDYFEALNKPAGRSIHLTAVGMPFPVGADPIIDGAFTAYGEPGRDICWLVKAERFGGDFELEPTMTFDDYADYWPRG